MNTPERAELAQFLRNQFNTRLRTFTKAGTLGFAVTKLVDDMSEVSENLMINMNPSDPIVTSKGKQRVLAREYAMRKNPQNALASYVVLMQDFFKAKSSTVAGWRKIGKEQDERIFGTHKEGRKTVANYQMTDEERTNFWKVYRELYRTDWISIHDYSSDSQREVGSFWQSGTFDKADFESAYNALVEKLNAKPKFLPEHEPGNENDPFQQEGDADEQWLRDQLLG